MRTRRRTPLSLYSCMICVIASVTLCGCTTTRSRGPYTTSAAPRHRDSLQSQQLNTEGLERIEAGEYAEAEKNFRAALEADLFNSAAHNNLGLILLRDGKAYEAAWEFQFAAKLAPYSAEPRNNLGLVMERVGNLDQAVAHYEEALQLDADNVEVMGHLARAYVKRGSEPEDLRKLLKRLSLQDHGGAWDLWARRQLLRLGGEE